MKFSYAVGPSEPSLLEHTIGQALRIAAIRWPNAESLISRHQGVRLTWSELEQRAQALAAGLLSLGLRKGDRVGVWAPNCVEWTITQFGTALAGLIQVNVNPAYQAVEAEHALRAVGVRALICAERHRTTEYVAMVEALAPEIAVSAPGALRAERLPDLRCVISIGEEARPGWLRFDEIMGSATEPDRALLAVVERSLDARDPINIQFTSGTTGLPKAATLSHRSVLNNGYFVGLGMGLTAGDRLCVPVPLYHCFGMVMSNLACCVHGAAIIYPSEGFSPLAVLEAVEAERCTALHGVPTMFIAELEHPDFDRFDLSSLRTGLMAGAPCPAETMARVMGRMNMRDVGIAYGMTETSPVSFQTATTDPVERRVTTIGRVQPHLEVRIVDPATGEVVSRGVPGELCTRGYSVMIGYWGEPERTADMIRDGWMHTGDLAVMDEEGFGRIVGRIKDMIIRGGENIYPREIEDFLLGHPAIEDAYVVGVPDVRFGEEVCACVKLREGHRIDAATLAEHFRGRLAHYKAPRYFRFVPTFPMTVTGKVQKHLLRAQSAAELGLGDADKGG